MPYEDIIRKYGEFEEIRKWQRDYDAELKKLTKGKKLSVK